MIETSAERASMFSGWGVATTASGATINGHFDDEDAADIGLSGTAPVFTALREDLEAASVAVHSILTIVNHTGRAVGSFRVAVWQPQDDGEVITLRLEKQP